MLKSFLLLLETWSRVAQAELVLTMKSPEDLGPPASMSHCWSCKHVPPHPPKPFTSWSLSSLFKNSIEHFLYHQAHRNTLFMSRESEPCDSKDLPLVKWLKSAVIDNVLVLSIFITTFVALGLGRRKKMI